jgi:hypothetical protein
MQITAFQLKIIAIVGMFLNHVALALRGQFSLGPEIFLMIAGGFTFPIMAFLLTEGFKHTSDHGKYEKRLLVFFGISFLPHLFSLGSGMNIMFTLWAGLFLLGYRKKHGSNATFWLIAILLTLATALFEWGIIGPIVILLFGSIQNEKLRRILPPIVFVLGLLIMGAFLAAFFFFLANLGFDMSDAVEESIAGAFFPIGSILAIPLLLMYKGERGRPMKTFFYVFYPAHLAFLAVLSLFMGTNVLVNLVNDFIQGFQYGFQQAIGG